MVIRCENILLALKQFLIIHPRIFQVKINDFSFSSLQCKVLWRTLIKPFIEYIFSQPFIEYIFFNIHAFQLFSQQNVPNNI